jgi:hypothetical protein
MKKAMILLVLTALAIAVAGCLSPFKPVDQKPKADAKADAGRDVKQTIYNIAATGSGWPLVAVLGLAAFLFWRSKSRTEKATVGVAGAIQAMGPGPQRDRLLGSINTRLPDKSSARKRLDHILDKQGLRVKTQNKGE